MRRSLAAVFWSLCLVIPVQVSALGVGDIALDSALNEPFSAEIPFESYVEADFDGLTVQLASEDTFVRYGLDLPLFMKDFSFAVVDGASGSPVIRITSRRPVSEPFVTLLLDIKWASGRLLREYTVLLDPPLFEAAAVAQPVAPAVTAPAPGATTAPGQSAGQVVRAPAPQPRSPAPLPRGVDSAAQPVPVIESAAQSAPVALSGTYNVQRRDTLWGIAERVRGSSDMTVNQVMLALYNANPEAFLGNINKLKAGAILRVPDASAITDLSPSAATAAVREQNAALSGAATPAAEPARLELVTPGTQSAAADGSAGQLDGSGSAAESAELNSRIGELEAELSESQRLVQLKDAELAALQRRVEALESAPADMDMSDGDVALDDSPLLLDEPADAEAEPLEDEAVFADEVGAVDDVTEQADTGTEDQVAADAPPVAADTSPAEESSFLGQLFSNIWLWVSAAVVLLLALFIARRRKTDDEDDFAASGSFASDELSPEHDETLRDIGATPAHDESILVEEGTDAGALSDFVDAGGVPDREPEAANETSRLDDLLDFDTDTPATTLGDAVETETPLEKTISTGAPLNLDQADPIAEAEFHMAYGLYDQAADLLERALETDPDNRAYRVKLVEVFFVWENRDGFLKHAQLLHDSSPDKADSDWNKVVILGKQLCPDESLFSGATATPDADSMDLEFTADSGDADLDFTLGGTDVKTLDADFTAADDAVDDASEDADLDFDLGADFDGGDDDNVAFDLSDLGEESSDTLETPTVEADLGASADGETLETPTLESELADDAATMESPALNDEGDSASTMETPTLENPMNEATVESPTLESIQGDGETTEMPALSDADFDLGDLDGDGDGLNPSADLDVDFGGADDLDVDLSGLAEEDEPEGDSTTLASTAEGLADDDATLMANFGDLDDPTQIAGDVDIESALEAEIDAELDLQSEGGGDTVEQPQIDADEVELGDTAEQPAISSASGLDMDLGLDAEEADEDLATAIQESSLPEDATMTEVGTKLDLARAYIDMGDPDGARSILGEVLDEGADEQQQEARQMLEELGD